MNMQKPIVINDAPVRDKASAYPEPFASMVKGRVKRPLGDLFGLKNFGVNFTTLKPGALSALQHSHSCQDEFVYIISGTLTLILGNEEHKLTPGMAIGFPAKGQAHHLRNDCDEDATYLEIGDRTEGDLGHYPNDDLVAEHDGSGWVFKHKDGTPYR